MPDKSDGMLPLNRRRRPRGSVARIRGASKPSPGHNRVTERLLNQEVSMPLYWRMDADPHTVEIQTPEAHSPIVEDPAITRRPDGAGEPLVILLAELFRAP